MGAGASTEHCQTELNDVISKSSPEDVLKAIKDALGNVSTLPPSFRKELIQFSEQLDGADRDKTSLLQLQQGLFRLLQGAAYRTYTVKYSLNFHTHKRVKALPYLWPNFVQFVQAAVEVYRCALVSSGVIKDKGTGDDEVHKVLDDLVLCVQAENQALQDRIAGWKELQLTPEQQQCQDQMLRERENKEDIKEDFTEYAQQAVFQRKFAEMEDGTMANVAKRVLNSETWKKDEQEDKANKIKEHLRAQQELSGYHEGFSKSYEVTKLDEGKGELFLSEWRQVLLETHDEAVDGAMIQIRFWYEKFMPCLFDVCSIASQIRTFNASATEGQNEEDETWFKQAKESGEFDPWGKDLEESWDKNTPKVKTCLRQAWRLTRHYLNGPMKLRERGDESGADHRQTGALSQYVSFVDVYVGRSYIQDQEMRISFPYFIGTATWIWKHTLAEICCASTPELGNVMLDKFKQYMQTFVTMYPCPYCRHHLNAYVIVGRERELYPIEYLFLGWKPVKDNLSGKVTAMDKISAITSPETLRLFLWKLHNTVNSSIARTESWYHSERDAVYTSRYWPNIDALCHRSENIGVGLVASERVRKTVTILKIATKLAQLRDEILELELEKVIELSESVFGLIKVLDVAIVDSGFLQETYAFDPALEDEEPSISEKEREHIRHEDFTLA